MDKKEPKQLLGNTFDFIIDLNFRSNVIKVILSFIEYSNQSNDQVNEDKDIEFVESLKFLFPIGSNNKYIALLLKLNRVTAANLSSKLPKLQSMTVEYMEEFFKVAEEVLNQSES